MRLRNLPHIRNFFCHASDFFRHTRKSGYPKNQNYTWIPAFVGMTVLILCLFCSAVFAKDPPPLALIKQISGQTLSALQRYKGKLSNKETIENIVKSIVMPHFDLTHVSRFVIGREAFANYIIDMYSWILSSYNNETLSFKPVRNFDPSQNKILIYSIVHRPGSRSVNLNYRLIKRGVTWKIYDLSVNGVSMVQSYRAQYLGTLGHINWPITIYNERG
jgi:phospholipid transport system substrate-binding protein